MSIEPHTLRSAEPAAWSRWRGCRCFFALEGKRAVVAGGTAAAAWKAELLSAAGARVDVYAERHVRRDDALAGSIRRAARSCCMRAPGSRRSSRRGDRDRRLRRRGEARPLRTAARAAGVPVNVIDKPAFCDFSFGAIVNRSPLVIGISTDGAAPVFAQAIRAKLEALLPQGFARLGGAARALARGAASVRPVVRRRAASSGSFSPSMRSPIPNSEPAQADFDRLRSPKSRTGATVEHGSVTLVGAGPGRSRTADAARGARAAIGRRDPVRRSRVGATCSISPAAKRKKMLVGKTGFGPSCKQDDINALMVIARQAAASAWCA